MKTILISKVNLSVFGSFIKWKSHSVQIMSVAKIFYNMKFLDFLGHLDVAAGESNVISSNLTGPLTLILTT